MKHHGKRQHKEKQIADDIDRCRGDVGLCLVDTNTVGDRNVPVHGHGLASKQDEAEEDDGVNADNRNGRPDCPLEPSLRGEAQVEDEEGKFSKGAAEDVNACRKVDILVLLVFVDLGSQLIKDLTLIYMLTVSMGISQAWTPPAP